MRLATHVDGPLLRISGGRLRLSFVIPVLLLRCRGAKSGVLREVPLLYVPYPAGTANLLLVASNAGQPSLPAWYTNVKASSSVEALVDRQWHRYGHRELAGSEREAAWQAALAVYPGYAAYAARNSRTIPVLQLHRLGLAIDE